MLKVPSSLSQIPFPSKTISKPREDFGKANTQDVSQGVASRDPLFLHPIDKRLQYIWGRDIRLQRAPAAATGHLRENRRSVRNPTSSRRSRRAIENRERCGYYVRPVCGSSIDLFPSG